MAVLTTSAGQAGIPMPAVDYRQLFGLLIATAGVRASTDLLVSQRAAGANMSVDVAAGGCAVADGAGSGGGFYGYTQPAVANTVVSAAHASLPRIDRICVRVRDVATGGAANDSGCVSVDGTATAGATLANLTGVTAVPVNCLLLANVLVPAASGSVVTANIDTTGAAMSSAVALASPAVRPMLRSVAAPAAPKYIYTAAPMGSASGSSGAANMAHICQFYVPTLFTVTLVGVTVTLSAGNWDVGIYNSAFTRMWSRGGVAMPGAAQSVTVLVSAGAPTSLVLQPGTYYFAWAHDNAGAQLLGATNINGFVGTVGLFYSKTASYPLPVAIASPTDEGLNASPNTPVAWLQ